MQMIQERDVIELESILHLQSIAQLLLVVEGSRPWSATPASIRLRLRRDSGHAQWHVELPHRDRNLGAQAIGKSRL